MIAVMRVNKVGNRVQSYTCTDGNRTIDLTKQQLSKYIDDRKVVNATKQVYNGTLIIRVNDYNPSMINNLGTGKQNRSNGLLKNNRTSLNVINRLNSLKMDLDRCIRECRNNNCMTYNDVVTYINNDILVIDHSFKNFKVRYIVDINKTGYRLLIFDRKLGRTYEILKNKKDRTVILSRIVSYLGIFDTSGLNMNVDSAPFYGVISGFVGPVSYVLNSAMYNRWVTGFGEYHYISWAAEALKMGVSMCRGQNRYYVKCKNMSIYRRNYNRSDGKEYRIGDSITLKTFMSFSLSFPDDFMGGGDGGHILNILGYDRGVCFMPVDYMYHNGKLMANSDGLSEVVTLIGTVLKVVNKYTIEGTIVYDCVIVGLDNSYSENYIRNKFRSLMNAFHYELTSACIELEYKYNVEITIKQGDYYRHYLYDCEDMKDMYKLYNENITLTVRKNEWMCGVVQIRKREGNKQNGVNCEVHYKMAGKEDRIRFRVRDNKWLVDKITKLIKSFISKNNSIYNDNLSDIEARVIGD